MNIAPNTEPRAQRISIFMIWLISCNWLELLYLWFFTWILWRPIKLYNCYICKRNCFIYILFPRFNSCFFQHNKEKPKPFACMAIGKKFSDRPNFPTARFSFVRRRGVNIARWLFMLHVCVCWNSRISTDVWSCQGCGSNLD